MIFVSTISGKFGSLHFECVFVFSCLFASGVKGWEGRERGKERDYQMGNRESIDNVINMMIIPPTKSKYKFKFIILGKKQCISNVCVKKKKIPSASLTRKLKVSKSGSLG